MMSKLKFIGYYFFEQFFEYMVIAHADIPIIQPAIGTDGATRAGTRAFILFSKKTLPTAVPDKIKDESLIPELFLLRRFSSLRRLSRILFFALREVCAIVTLLL